MEKIASVRSLPQSTLGRYFKLQEPSLLVMCVSVGEAVMFRVPFHTLSANALQLMGFII